MQTRFIPIEVQGYPLKIAYNYQAGSSGPPVLWIHGMGSSRQAFWDVVARKPIGGDYFIPDLPGFGASALPPRRQALPDFVEAVLQLIREWRLHRPIVVGHSFGGMVAAELAIAHPDVVGGVIFVASAGFTSPEHALTPTRWVWVNRVGIWLTSWDWFGHSILEALGLDPRQVPAATLSRMRYGWRRSREMARMQRFYETPQLAERFHRAAIPAVAIWGERDRLFPLEQVAPLLAVPTWVVPGAGHLPFDYDPPMFCSQLSKAYATLTDLFRYNAHR